MKPNSVLLFLCVIFSIAGIISAYFSFQSDSPEAIVQETEAKLEKQIKRAEEEMAEVIKGIDNPSSLNNKVSCPFFIYYKSSLLYWSDNSFVPTPQTVVDEFERKLLKTSNERRKNHIMSLP